MTGTEPTVRSTPVPTVRVADPAARTDVPAPRRPGPVAPDALVRPAGIAVAAGSAAWAVALATAPDSAAGAVAAVAFQCSLLGLLVMIGRTAATGSRRAGRILLAVEAVVLVLATVQSVADAVAGTVAGTVAAVLDLTWPLSMLGMLVVGITVACAGRWRGLARGWVVVATSWIAFLPVMLLVPKDASAVVAGGHVVVGYVVLGVILAARPGLTRR